MKKRFLNRRLFGFVIVGYIFAIISSCANPSKKSDDSSQTTVKQDTLRKEIDSILVQFDHHLNLQARYPKLFDAPPFKEWLSTNLISNWHETRLSQSNKRNVIIQSKSTKSIYAFNITDPLNYNITINDIANFKIDSWPPDNTESFTTIIKNKDGANLKVIRPVVIFGKAKKLVWEAEFSQNDSINIYEIDLDAKSILSQKNISSNIENGAYPSSPGADETANNELHHLADFKTEAENWTKGATTVEQKCRLIFNNVNRTYTYDGNIPNISEFTWSDLLVRDANGRKGICDEWAVVEITYLRSLGIPAVIKFLIWKDAAGNGVGHAVVEYKDGGSWKQMDALWRAFNDPAIYRRTGGAQGVTVMDAYDPLDSRSTVPAWGVQDPNGDQKLNPYKDYVISPTYPGNSRPGYSN